MRNIKLRFGCEQHLSVSNYCIASVILMVSTYTKRLIILLATVLLPACSGPANSLSSYGCALLMGACTVEVNVAVNTTASKRINPDERGQPLSLVLHVYQLKSSKTFTQLTADDLIKGKTEADLLGGDFISSKELVVLPGAKQNTTVTISPEAQYVAVVGFFRRPDQHFWRLLYSANAVRSKGINLKIDSCYLQSAKPDISPIPGQPKSVKPSCRQVGY